MAGSPPLGVFPLAHVGRARFALGRRGLQLRLADRPQVADDDALLSACFSATDRSTQPVFFYNAYRDRVDAVSIPALGVLEASAESSSERDSIEREILVNQATKGMWWMPWR